MNYEKCPHYKELPEDWKKGMEQEGCIYPYYGLAPHTHDMLPDGVLIIGSTKILSKDKWPDNFIEDIESPGCGIYKCPYNNICENK